MSNTEPIPRIDAKRYLDQSGSIVRSGEILASAVVDVLARERVVEVDLTNLKGASSSYFNAFLSEFSERLGLEELGARVIPRFGTPTQESVFKRSLAAFEIALKNQT